MAWPDWVITVPFVAIRILRDVEKIFINAMPQELINRVEGAVRLELSIETVLKLVEVLAKVCIVCEVAHVFACESCSVKLSLRG